MKSSFEFLITTMKGEYNEEVLLGVHTAYDSKRHGEQHEFIPCLRFFLLGGRDVDSRVSDGRTYS